MTMWRPLRNCLVAWSMLAACVCASGAELLVDGLARPTAVAARISEEGLFRLFIWEADTARVTLVEVDQEGAVQKRLTLIEGDEVAVARLACLSDNLLLLAGEGLRLYWLLGEGGPKLTQRVQPLGAAAPCHALTVDPRRVFTLVEGRVFRARHERDRLTLLRPFEVESRGAVDLAVSERGYLVALRDRGETDAELAFYDPRLPGAAPAVAVCEGLREPVALAYGAAPAPVERLLFALDAQGGLYRLDAASHSGKQLHAMAARVGDAPGATGMVVVGESTLYVTTTDGAGEGRLVRIEAGMESKP